MLSSTHAVHPGEAVLIRYEGPKRQRYAGDVLYHRGDLVGPGARPKHRAHHRRPFLRCLKGAGHRPRQPGGCGRRADRTCGGGRPHPYRHPRAQPVHHRSKRRRENAGTDGGDPRCTPCCVESPLRPDIQKVCSGFTPGTPYRPCAAAIWNSTLPQYRAYLSVSYEGKRKL